VEEFHRSYKGPELGPVLEDLVEHGVDKGIIELENNAMSPTGPPR
jgi:hypothetical protein